VNNQFHVYPKMPMPAVGNVPSYSGNTLRPTTAAAPGFTNGSVPPTAFYIHRPPMKTEDVTCKAFPSVRYI